MQILCARRSVDDRHDHPSPSLRLDVLVHGTKSWDHIPSPGGRPPLRVATTTALLDLAFEISATVSCANADHKRTSGDRCRGCLEECRTSRHLRHDGAGSVRRMCKARKCAGCRSRSRRREGMVKSDGQPQLPMPVPTQPQARPGAWGFLSAIHKKPDQPSFLPDNTMIPPSTSRGDHRGSPANACSSPDKRPRAAGGNRPF